MIRIVIASAVIVIALIASASASTSQGIFSHTAPGNSLYNPYLHP